jgi:hypothetical protein
MEWGAARNNITENAWNFEGEKRWLPCCAYVGPDCDHKIKFWNFKMLKRARACKKQHHWKCMEFWREKKMATLLWPDCDHKIKFWNFKMLKRARACKKQHHWKCMEFWREKKMATLLCIRETWLWSQNKILEFKNVEARQEGVEPSAFCIFSGCWSVYSFKRIATENSVCYVYIVRVD